MINKVNIQDIGIDHLYEGKTFKVSTIFYNGVNKHYYMTISYKDINSSQALKSLPWMRHFRNRLSFNPSNTIEGYIYKASLAQKIINDIIRVDKLQLFT